MTTHYLYLGAQSCGWLDIEPYDQLQIDSEQSAGEGALGLRNATASERLTTESQKEQFIKYSLGHLIDFARHSIVLLIDNGTESVEWHRTLVDSKRVVDEGVLHVESTYKASALRKKYCMCLAEIISPSMNNLPGPFINSGSALLRRVEYTQQQDCLAWYSVVKRLSGNYPVMLSFSLLIESVVQKNCDWTHGMLIVDGGFGYERHLYFRSGLMCFSRWVKNSNDDSIEKFNNPMDRSFQTDSSRACIFPVHSTLSAVQNETQTYLLQHFPISTNCECIDSEHSSVGEKSVIPCYMMILHHTNSSATFNFRQSLIDCLEPLENAGIQKYLLKIRVSANKHRLHNSETLLNQEKSDRKKRYKYVQLTLLTWLVGLLCWQVSALAVTHQQISQVKVAIEKQLEESRKSAQPLSTDYATSPTMMQWLVESQRETGQRSIILPLAVLSKLQDVIHPLPAITLTDIEWLSKDQGLFASIFTEKKPITFRLVLGGFISQSSFGKADEVDPVQGLRQFELFIKSLKDAFGVTQPDRVVYPFGADTNDRIRQSDFQSDSEPKTASNSFSVEVSIPQQHLQQEISSLDPLLGEPGR